MEALSTWPLDGADVAAVRSSWNALLGGLPVPLRAAAAGLLDEIATPRWALEWSLPRWLGEAFGLDPDSTLALVRSNVWGLAYFRLQDDFLDGELAPVGSLPAPAASLVATALYQAWLFEYVRLFDGNSPFWPSLAEFTAQWIAAAAGDAPDDGLRAGDDQALLSLAGRGAPLKICCVAACLLAGKPLPPELLAAVDHLLAAAVLVDHAADWPADLAAGRYNAFAAFVSPRPLAMVPPGDWRLFVWQGIHLGGGASSYFQLVRGQIRAALQAGEAAACPGLHRFIEWFDGQAALYGARLVGDATARLRAAAARLFGPAAPAGPLSFHPDDRLTKL